MKASGSAKTEFALAARRPDDVLELEALAVGVAQLRPGAASAEAVRGVLDRLAERVADQVDRSAPPDRLAVHLRRALGEFSGSADDYSRPEASYLDEVLRTRRGLPILLSVVWILVGERLGVPIVGVGYPGHFLVALDGEGARLFLDPFHGGRERDPAALLADLPPGTPRAVLQPVKTRALVLRMLTNLRHLFAELGEHAQLLEVIDRIQLLVGEREEDVRDRGLVLLHLDRRAEALRDLERFVKIGTDPRAVRDIERLLQGIRR